MHGGSAVLPVLIVSCVVYRVFTSARATSAGHVAVQMHMISSLPHAVVITDCTFHPQVGFFKHVRAVLSSKLWVRAVHRGSNALQQSSLNSRAHARPQGRMPARCLTNRIGFRM